MLGRRADPIAAIASAPGKGAVGVVRVSGAGLAPLALALTGKALRPRHAHYGPLLDASGAAIDHGLNCITVADACAASEPQLQAPALAMISVEGGIFGAVANSAALVSLMGLGTRKETA